MQSSSTSAASGFTSHFYPTAAKKGFGIECAMCAAPVSGSKARQLASDWE
jgi:hypothetical protein